MAKYECLTKFYASKAWVTFRDNYINTRLSQDGYYHCDMCGLPIERAGELILHHKIELTPDNVYDVMVALNTDNIQQVHKSCHTKHHKIGLGRTKHVYLIYGPPCAGKLSLALERMWEGDILIDIDKLYAAVSGQSIYHKPKQLLNNVLSLQDLLLDQVKTRFGKWDNAWIVGGFPDKHIRERIIKETGAEPVFLNVTKEECYERLLADPSRGEEWRGYIDKWFRKYTT